MRLEQEEDGAPQWWPQLGWLDWVCFGVLSAVIVALCVARSRTRFFWSDELFSFSLLHDHVLAHALHGWWEGSDSGGLLYYLIGYVWFRIFETNLLSLRLLSTTCFIVAIGIIWIMARRRFAAPIVAVTAALVFLAPTYLVWQEGNGRFYGLFLASAAFAAACTMAAAERQHLSRLLLVLTCCAHACLIGSHMLGIVYSAGLLTALVVSDLLEHRKRLVLYGSVLLAWVVVVPLSYHSIHATATIAQGVFWTVRPTFRELVRGLFAYNRRLVTLAELLVLLTITRYFVSQESAREMRKQIASLRSSAVVVGGLLLAQLAIFIKSRVGVSIYSDRYLLPLTIALVFLFAEGFTLALGSTLVTLISRPLAGLIVTLLAITGGVYLARRADPYVSMYAATDYPVKMERLLPAQRDVVVTHMPVFMMLNLFDPEHHYLFATDWKYDNATVGADLSGQRLMENVRRGGVAPHQVMDIPQIVNNSPEFILVAEPDRVPWIKERFGQNGTFEVTKLGEISDWYPQTIWRIRCLHPERGCPLGPRLRP